MNKGLQAFVAMGLVGTVATVAPAQPYVVNVTGATLLQNFVKSPASTRDFIDVNHDGVTLNSETGIRQQLAPDIASPDSPFAAGSHWLVHYRAVGSVNGFKELLRNGRSYSFGGATDPLGFPVAAVGSSDGAYYNRTLFTAGGVASGPGATWFTAANPGGFPWRTTTPASGSPTPLRPGSAGDGLRADVSPLDVPSKWAATVVGAPSVLRTPGQSGYGTNPQPTRQKNGAQTTYGDASTTSGAYWSRLADLGTANLYSGVPGDADANTIFDTRLAYAPIVPIANPGTKVSQIRMSELRHLFVTGRMPSGENLMAITRDSGSGTRNGWMNSLQTDPSFGVGENIGAEVAASNTQILGANYSPSNHSGTGGVRNAVVNTRLGIGYVGGDSTGGLVHTRYEMPSVMNDLLGGTQWVRTTAANVINNATADTWRIAGPASLATFGDPGAEPVVDGGLGNATPRMRNPQAAAYVNNIARSIEAFSLANNQSAITNAFSPGEAAATFFVLPAGVAYVQDTLDADGDGNVTEWIPNAGLVASLNSWELANSIYATNSQLNTPFDASNLGFTPTRATGVTYSDGVANGGTFKNQAGVNVSYGQAVNPSYVRNAVAGDFDNDGLRNLTDIPGLVAAWRDRAGLGSWDGVGVNGGASDTSAVIEILGDFNGDGSFDATDVRYFADGLAMTVGSNPVLDRRAGFTAVDNASLAQGGSLNFFGVASKSTGSTYAAGDARADVAGAPVLTQSGGNTVSAYFKATPGFAPTGADGSINGWDVCYVFRQFRQNPFVFDGALNWSNVNEAAGGGDLSADMNGDRVIDVQDVQEIVTVILATSMHDVNLDGVVNAADEAIITANQGMTNACWQQGDINGDGVVNGYDASEYNSVVRCGIADVGSQGGVTGWDGVKDNNDFVVFIEQFFNRSPFADMGRQGGLLGADGQWDNNDFVVFIDAFFQPC